MSTRRREIKKYIIARDIGNDMYSFSYIGIVIKLSNSSTNDRRVNRDEHINE